MSQIDFVPSVKAGVDKVLHIPSTSNSHIVAITWEYNHAKYINNIYLLSVLLLLLL